MQRKVRKRRKAQTVPISCPTWWESTAPASSIPLALFTATTAALPISFAAPFITTYSQSLRIFLYSFLTYWKLQLRKAFTFILFGVGWAEQEMKCLVLVLAFWNFQHLVGWNWQLKIAIATRGTVSSFLLKPRRR